MSSSELVQASTRFAGVTDLLREVMHRAQLTGAALHVEVAGEVVYRALLGDTTTETMLPIASAAKWLTAATVLTEVDAGRIDLDEPVAAWLPSFAADEHKRPITTRHLLSLTSGLAGGAGTLGEHDWTITLADFVDQIAETDTVGEAGRDFRYGSYGFQVAGRVAEITSGLRWHDLFASRIVGPLDLRATAYPLRSDNPLLAGSCQSTLDDYVAFLRMLQSGGVGPTGERVLADATVREMQRNQAGELELRSGSPQRLAEQSRYGLGCWLDRHDDDGKGIVISSPGAFGSRPWIDHSRSLLAMLFIQRRLDDRDLADAAGASAHTELQQAVNEAVDG